MNDDSTSESRNNNLSDNCTKFHTLVFLFIKMRRSFLRTSGSPQAPAIVETPAHYAPTLFCRLALLSEVVIGSVEPTMSCASFETRVQRYNFSANYEAT